MAEVVPSGAVGGTQRAGAGDAFLELLADERRAYALPPQLRELSERFVQGVL